MCVFRPYAADAKGFHFVVSCTFIAVGFLKTQSFCCEFSLQHPGIWGMGGLGVQWEWLTMVAAFSRGEGCFWQRYVLLALTEL